MNILPVPQQVDYKEGVFYLRDVKIYISSNCEYRIVKAVKVLRNEIEEITKTPVVYTKYLECPSGDRVIVVEAGNGQSEEYEVTITEHRVTLKSESQVGAFYAIQTLRQIVNECKSALYCVTIKDKPDFATRGLYYDVTRGCVPKLETLKRLIETCAYYKINQFQVYIEHAFDFEEYKGISSTKGYLTAEEMLELDEICNDNFIEFVPSLATFGHLRELVNSAKYVHLNEMDIKPSFHERTEARSGAHYTIDASNEESIRLITSLLDQYIPLFRSDKFNICCDETFDICQGKNKGKDKGQVYWEFAKKIIEHVQSRGKKVMMWADIVLEHQELLPQIPKDITMLNWSYEENPNLAQITTLRESGLTQIVCTAASTYGRMVDQIDRTIPDIVKMSECGYENGAVGLLNTIWTPGKWCTMNDNLFAIVTGAAKSWNVHTPIDKEFEDKVNLAVYADDSLRVVDFMKELSKGVHMAPMGCLGMWYNEVKYDRGSKILKINYDDPFEDFDGAEKAYRRCLEIAEQLKEMRMASGSKTELYDDLILSAEAISLANRLFLKIAGAEGHQDKATLYCDFQIWLEKFAAAWRRDNQESGLRGILWYIEDIFEII